MQQQYLATYLPRSESCSADLGLEESTPGRCCRGRISRPGRHRGSALASPGAADQNESNQSATACIAHAYIGMQE